MATNVEAVEASSSIPHTENCPNCGAVPAGSYCQQCGQKKTERHEFALKHFFSHLIHELTHLDSNKILRTFFTLLFRPGLLTSEYLAGKKGKYINPVRIYLTFSAIYFLFAWSTLGDVRGGGAARTARFPGTIAIAKKKGVEPLALAQKIYQKAEKFSAVLRFTSVLISGLFLALLYLGLKKYYVEHLFFSLHYYSFDFFFKSVFAFLFIAVAALGSKLPAVVLDLFYPLALVYLILALRKVYNQSWTKTALKAVVLFILETALFIAVNMAGFLISFTLV
jgi:hypothetical protein